MSDVVFITFSNEATRECGWHRRNSRRDRGRLVPQLLGWGPTMYWSSQLLGRSFQEAINFTASSHQSARISICVFKNFPGVIPPDPHSGRGDPSRTQHPARPLAGRAGRRCWDSKLGPPQLFSRGCAPGGWEGISDSLPVSRATRDWLAQKGAGHFRYRPSRHRKSVHSATESSRLRHTSDMQSRCTLPQTPTSSPQPGEGLKGFQRHCIFGLYGAIQMLFFNPKTSPGAIRIY